MTAMTSNGHLQSALKQVLLCPRGTISLVLNFTLTHSWVLLWPVMLDLERIFPFQEPPPLSLHPKNGGREAIAGSRH